MIIRSLKVKPRMDKIRIDQSEKNEKKKKIENANAVEYSPNPNNVQLVAKHATTAGRPIILESYAGQPIKTGSTTQTDAEK